MCYFMQVHNYDCCSQNSDLSRLVVEFIVRILFDLSTDTCIPIYNCWNDISCFNAKYRYIVAVRILTLSKLYLTCVSSNQSSGIFSLQISYKYTYRPTLFMNLYFFDAVRILTNSTEGMSWTRTGVRILPGFLRQT